jgi:NADH-quinone oxidoreductase subunit J
MAPAHALGGGIAHNQRRLKPATPPSILSPFPPRTTGLERTQPRRLFSGSVLGHVIHPAIFFALLVLGALGVGLALPRTKATPQLFGALIGALAVGLLLIVMGINARGHLPNLYFYIFSLIGVGSALRVITHPRPVYAALYFIMTVLASAGLFLILSAEFMAFALIIVYAGAILITYLFVIMLATQAPEEGEVEVLAPYDTQAREPIAATVVGFLLLAVLSVMLFRGVDQLPAPTPVANDALLAHMPRKVDTVLRNHNLLHEGERAVFFSRTNGAAPVIEIQDSQGAIRSLPEQDWPPELRVGNIEHLGFNLLRDHPGTIEIAGVILLMAMLGAVVLSRKQVQLDEDAKRHQALRTQEGTG